MLKSTSVKKGCKISIKFPKFSAGFILKISPKTDDYKATDEKFVQYILKISSLDKVFGKYQKKDSSKVSQSIFNYELTNFLKRELI